MWVTSGGCRIQVKPAAMKQDGGAELVTAAESKGVAFDLFDFAVEAFGAGIGDVVGDGVDNALPMVFDGMSGIAHRFQSGMGGPPVPFFEKGAGGFHGWAPPDIPEVFLDGPRPPGFDGGRLEPLEVRGTVLRDILLIVKDNVS